MDRFAALTVFVAVVEKGSFAQAAATLRLSRAMVSKTVGQLEQHLDARLLHRTTRRLSLTETGEAFFAQAKTILGLLDEAEQAAGAAAARPTGTLRVNAPVSFGVRHLATAVAAFQADAPDVTVELMLNDRIVDLVQEGYDVAVRIARLKDSSLMAKRLAPCRMLAVAAPAYLDRHGRPEAPAELSRHACLTYSYAAVGDRWSFTHTKTRAEETVHVGGPLYSNNGDALLHAALAGMGITYLPSFILWEAVRDSRLETVLPDWSMPELGIYAVWSPTRHLPVKVRRFVDGLAERFRGTPYWDRMGHPT